LISDGSGIGSHDLQFRVVLFMAPVLIGHVLVFWDLLHAAGRPSTQVEQLDGSSHVN